MSCREGSKETGGDRQRNIGGRARFTRFFLALVFAGLAAALAAAAAFTGSGLGLAGVLLWVVAATLGWFSLSFFTAAATAYPG